mmetsp:Transcript_154731/g.475372  ORF Transcript_154731/g.475372 Transcript_154731/m.475372 type:complete len:200 (+) Transcript_154731:1938-2537(+)
MWALPGGLLHGRRDAAVRVALAQHGVHGAAQDPPVPHPRIAVGVALRGLGVARHVATQGSHLGDRGLQLRDGGADVGELDDVRLRELCNPAELREGVLDALLRSQAFGELRKDARGQGYVGLADPNARRPRECLHDRKPREGRHPGRLIGERVYDRGARTPASVAKRSDEVSIRNGIAALKAGGLQQLPRAVVVPARNQ